MDEKKKASNNTSQNSESISEFTCIYICHLIGVLNIVFIILCVFWDIRYIPILECLEIKAVNLFSQLFSRLSLNWKPVNKK